MGLLGIKVRLGLFPGAAKAERRSAKLKAEYQRYCECAQSEEMKRFTELSKYINSPEYQEYASDPETDKHELKKLQHEWAKLQKSKRLKQFFQDRANESRFAPVTSWELAFEDDFDGSSLNGEKWLTRYFGAEKGGVHQSYTLAGDLQCNTEGKNVKLVNSKALIETRKETVNGLLWNPLTGFVPVDFPYSSGLINTANSFRTTYGKIEAKVKVPRGAAYHAFWLAGENLLPHVNIFNYVDGKFYVGNYWGKPGDQSGESSDITSITGAFAGKSNIFTLEWEKNQLTWLINGIVVKTMTMGVPNQPLYIAFASGLKAGKTLSTPVQMEIEWVRCYSKKKSK